MARHSSHTGITCLALWRVSLHGEHDARPSPVATQHAMLTGNEARKYATICSMLASASTSACSGHCELTSSSTRRMRSWGGELGGKSSVINASGISKFDNIPSINCGSCEQSPC